MRYLFAVLLCVNFACTSSRWESHQPKIDWIDAELEWEQNTGDFPKIERLPMAEDHPAEKSKPPIKPKTPTESLDIRTICTQQRFTNSV